MIANDCKLLACQSSPLLDATRFFPSPWHHCEADRWHRWEICCKQAPGTASKVVLKGGGAARAKGAKAESTLTLGAMVRCAKSPRQHYATVLIAVRCSNGQACGHEFVGARARSGSRRDRFEFRAGPCREPFRQLIAIVLRRRSLRRAGNAGNL